MKVTTAYNLLKFQPCILFNRLDLWNTFITRDSTQHQMLTIFLIMCLEDESTVGQSGRWGGIKKSRWVEWPSSQHIHQMQLSTTAATSLLPPNHPTDRLLHRCYARRNSPWHHFGETGTMEFGDDIDTFKDFAVAFGAFLGEIEWHGCSLYTPNFFCRVVVSLGMQQASSSQTVSINRFGFDPTYYVIRE